MGLGAIYYFNLAHVDIIAFMKSECLQIVKIEHHIICYQIGTILFAMSNNVKYILQILTLI